MKTIAIVLAVSVMTTGLAVIGIRTIQSHWFPTFRHVAVSLDLPGQTVSALEFGGHESKSGSPAAGVEARIGATGLVIAQNASGYPVGMDVVPAATTLRNIPQTVSYVSTARALIEVSAFPSSAPVLSAMIQMAASSSPDLPALVSVLSTEANERPDFLVNLDGPEQTALAAADANVKSQLLATFSQPTSLTSTLANTPAQFLATTAGPSQSNAPITQTPSEAPKVAQSLLTSSVPLLDQSGHTACESHSIQDALCLEAPIPSFDQYLNLTNWTESWELVYKTTDLQTPGGVVQPVGILPPAGNAPPSISGTISNVVQTLTTPVLDSDICHQAQGVTNPNTNNWIEPSACAGGDALGSALLSELTLTAQSATVQDYLSSSLNQSGLTAVGSIGAVPGPAATTSVMQTQEHIAGAVALGLTLVTNIVIPVFMLVLDAVLHASGKGDDSTEADPNQEAINQGRSDAATLEGGSGASVNIDEESQTALTAATKSVQGAVENIGDATELVVVGTSKGIQGALQGASEAFSRVATKSQEAQAAFAMEAANAQAAVKAASENVQSVLGQAAETSPALAKPFLQRAQDVANSAKTQIGNAIQTASATTRAALLSGISRISGTLAGASESAARALDKGTEQLEMTMEDAVGLMNQAIASASQKIQALIDGSKSGVQSVQSSLSEISQVLAGHIATGEDAMSALMMGVLGDQGGFLNPVLTSLQGNQLTTNQAQLNSLSSAVLVAMFGQLKYLVPIVFPQLYNPAALAGLVAGVAFGFIPVVGEISGTIDRVSMIAGDVQTWVDLTQTLNSVPWVHSFPPPASNQLTGSTNIAPLYQVSVPHVSQSPTSLGSLRSLLGGTSITKTLVVAADSSGDSFTIAPSGEVENSEVDVVNLSQLESLHLGLSGTAAVGPVVTMGQVPFRLMEARLPLGEGPATFAPAPTGSPPPGGWSVAVTNEGNGLSSRTVAAHITNVISLNVGGAQGPVAMDISLDNASLPSKTSYVGGFVSFRGGPRDGQLVGLVGVQTRGQLTALTGVGALYLFCQAEGPVCASERDLQP
jgi:hypothetical protein